MCIRDSIKTVLTLNADSTYQYSADYLERKDGHDEASGIFKVLANNVVEIIRPSSGETSYYITTRKDNTVKEKGLVL